MVSVTVLSRGRITIPRQVREALRIGAGDRVEFIEVAPSRFEIVARNRSIKELKGMFGVAPVAVSIDDMNRAIAERGQSAG